MLMDKINNDSNYFSGRNHPPLKMLSSDKETYPKLSLGFSYGAVLIMGYPSKDAKASAIEQFKDLLCSHINALEFKDMG